MNLDSSALQESADDSLLAEREQLQEEVDELMACLGQEAEKIEVLSGLLEQHGVDASLYLAQVVLALQSLDVLHA